ncbi:hypothetical protein [Roseburia amylophila]|uniref:LXG domain-containing protein n=1 Tax=Roseburia amylophila TaxID=2981794 RepID=A0ABT2SHE3_9FIRM|nr:hypothetical protein [Roseburia amylophila]MCU6718300.1 hypothetical protein [Roseburia amylophila]SCI57855.1 Uncharacterised protein [uncultured Roseburia sp.]
MIGEYEEVHSHADMYPIDMMVGYLRSIIGGQLGGSSATISTYDASVVNATEPFQLAQMMDGMLSTYLEQVKDRVNSCEEFYELQQQQWQESIRLRTEEGIVKTLVGVGTMILGGMLVVATCGMALPLVATVGVMAIGAGTVAYGFSNTVEGGQDVYAGVTGDPRMVSVNPIRDTLFASNPDLYYLIGNVLTIAASLILTGGMAANAAVSAGTSIGRAVVTEYAKQGLTVAASSYVDKRMTEATNSPLAGFVVGSLTGIATYGTLSELDSMANVSGLHSSFAEGMSKEDAQKYLDFLENGSKEGLTEAEIRGIGKVDEALALKKVNPEELLELRKQQLGNVGESGRKSKWWHEGYVNDLSDIQMILGVKQSDKGLSTLGSATRENAMSAGKAWVGDSYNVIKDNSGNILGYSSADGMRAFRIQYKPKEGMWKANFQENIMVNNPYPNPGQHSSQLKNVHIDILD